MIGLSALDLQRFGASRGIGVDPNLLKKEIPWERVLTAEGKRIVTMLGDIIIGKAGGAYGKKLKEDARRYYPTLTILALAWRACDYAMAEMKKGIIG